ncbi:MAG: GPP34 family phosphoprotein, partial [Verrucomicrobiia bacterium]
PLNNTILDPALATIAAVPEPKPIEHWLEIFANDAQAIKTRSLTHLVQTGILQQEEHRLLWLIPTRRYHTLDNREKAEVRARLHTLITSSDLPEPRDIVLLTLLKACNLLDEILPDNEIELHRERIQQLCKMDLIGQAVARSISEIQNSIMQSMLYLS